MFLQICIGFPLILMVFMVFLYLCMLMTNVRNTMKLHVLLLSHWKHLALLYRYNMKSTWHSYYIYLAPLDWYNINSTWHLCYIYRPHWLVIYQSTWHDILLPWEHRKHMASMLSGNRWYTCTLVHCVSLLIAISPLSDTDHPQAWNSGFTWGYTIDTEPDTDHHAILLYRTCFFTVLWIMKHLSFLASWTDTVLF